MLAAFALETSSRCKDVFLFSCKERKDDIKASERLAYWINLLKKFTFTLVESEDVGL